MTGRKRVSNPAAQWLPGELSRAQLLASSPFSFLLKQHTALGTRHTALGTRHSAQDTAHTLGGNSHRQAPRGSSAHPVKALGLEEMAVGTVQLPPSSGATAVDGFWNRDEEAMKSQHGPRPGPTHKVPSGLAAHGR